MMQARNQSSETNVQARYPTMVVLWVGQLMSIAALFFFSLFAGPTLNDKPDSWGTSLSSALLAAMGAFLVVISFIVKKKFLERSVDRQQVDLVQKAYLIAGAISEVSAILGVVVRFVTSGPDYHFLFLFAALGVALHFPRAQHLAAATYKSSFRESIS